MNTRTEQLKQIATASVWDGNLISKVDRDALSLIGYTEKVNGWNIITADGMRVAISLRLVKA